MIKNDVRKNLLEELAKDGNILNACRKSGIGRATFYRWLEGDLGFKKQARKAERIGRANMTSIAEHALMLKVRDKDLGAIKYLLSHNDPRYKPKGRKIYIEHSNTSRDESRKEMEEKWAKQSENSKSLAEALQRILEEGEDTTDDSS